MLLAAAATVQGVDVSFYAVVKQEAFNQTSALPPVPKGNPYRFDAIVALAGPDSVTGATVQHLPNGPVSSLAIQGTTLDFQVKTQTQNVLDASLPDGNYQLVINAVHDGAHAITLPLTGGAYPASDPFISNFTIAQAIKPNVAFTLTWTTFTGGTTNDFILVSITDVLGNPLFQTPAPGQPGALTGTARSIIIPANILPPNTTFGGRLIFAKVVAADLTSYPGVPGFAAYDKQTDFTLATTGVTSAQDVLTYNLTKQQTFDQNDADAPVPDTAAPFRFLATVAATSATSVSNVNLQEPNGASEPLPFIGAGLFRAAQNFLAQSALDAAFAPGTYTLSLTGVHDGPRALPLVLPAETYPKAPHVSNFAATQSINPGVVFDLTWDAFNGASPSDDFLVTVIDSGGGAVLSTNLVSTAAGFHFPLNTFQPGQTYQIVVNFRHFVSRDTNTYPGTVGSVLYSTRTLLNVKASSNVPAPSLAVLASPNTGPFQLQLLGQAGLQYVIEASTSLQPGSWTALTTDTATGGSLIFTDRSSSNFLARFYRGRTVL